MEEIIRLSQVESELEKLTEEESHLKELIILKASIELVNAEAHELCFEDKRSSFVLKRDGFSIATNCYLADIFYEVYSIEVRNSNDKVIVEETEDGVIWGGESTEPRGSGRIREWYENARRKYQEASKQ